MNSQAIEIAQGIRRHIKDIRSAEKRQSKQALPGFPFDAWLLGLSPLYRRSRRLYLEQGGRFLPSVISSPRTLSSDALLGGLIEYTPIGEELYWSATDPVERRSPKTSLERILELRSWCAPVFHEQSHRILWRFLPPPPPRQRGIHRYLNFCEALVVATDMALGDLLGPKLSRLFYLTGSTYDPGTRVPSELASRRAYRNYLHHCVRATYLNLELFEEGDLRKIIGNDKTRARAVDRCLRLDRGFVEITNITWQERNWRKLKPLSLRGGTAALELPSDPLDDRLIYLWAEKWFDLMGI